MTIDVGKVGMIPRKSIIVGERAREVMGDLDSMEKNMKKSGLITPLAVQKIGDDYLLLAGERRFRILSRNDVELIPARIYERELSELEIKVIEKSENFHRKDMEFYELDRLTLEIHQMQQALHGVKAPGPNQEGWDMEDTGEMLGGVSKGTVSMSVKRAEAREAFPELFEKCKTASDASKVMKKLDEAMVKEVIAKKIQECKPTGTLGQLGNCFVIRDFFEGVKGIPEGVMNLVEIDPPYAIDLNKKKKSDGESKYMQEDYNEVDIKEYQGFMYNVFKECHRVMADHSWLICWFAPEPWFADIHYLLKETGFMTTRMCGIWTKTGSGQNMRPQTRLSNNYEMFFYAWKGQPVLNKAGRSNDFRIPPVPAQQKVHPTERPIELMKELYDTFAFTGSRVLIPFLGSGNGLIAAEQLGMSPIGFELSKSYRDSFLVKVHNLSKGIQSAR